MASTTSETDEAWPGRRVTHAEFAADLTRRRAALDDVEAPRNTGDRRTESKRALLEAIGRTGARW